MYLNMWYSSAPFIAAFFLPNSGNRITGSQFSEGLTVFCILLGLNCRIEVHSET